MPKPKYILTAQDTEHDSDKDKTIASMQKAMDEKEKELKDAKAKIASNGVPDPHPPEVRDLKSRVIAAIKAMHEDDEKNMHAMKDDEHMHAMYDDEHMKKAIKAIEDIFDRGAGVPVKNSTEYPTSPKTNATIQGEPATKVVDAKTASLVASVQQLQNELSQPLIKKILTAKTLMGATEDVIKAEEIRLNQMSLTAIKNDFKSNEVFIEGALKANQENLDNQALTAKVESSFDFNGIALTANNGTEYSLDKAFGDMS